MDLVPMPVATSPAPSTSRPRAPKSPSSFLPTRRALVVAYCGGPACNAYKAGAQAAADLGYTNVKHLAAGISGWMDAGKPTEAKK